MSAETRVPDRFEAFVRTYQHMVFGTAVRLLGNRTDAEDVAQAVFLRAFERFAEIGVSPSAGGWLKTVATNLCLNHLTRYKARLRLFSELGSGADGEYDVEHDIPGPSSIADDLEQAQLADRLEHALQHLPDHQRVPVVLFHFEDKSYQEIASSLGVSLGKIKTDIHRGREALRRVLVPDHESH